jgi:uncharacterized membrane protein
MIWLGVIARGLYKRELGFIMADKVNWLAAMIFYLIFIGGLVYFVVNPSIIANDWSMALRIGMIFGFITYSTYDLTNLATLANWPLKITVIDIIWGTVLGGGVSTMSFFILKKLGS